MNGAAFNDARELMTLIRRVEREKLFFRPRFLAEVIFGNISPIGYDSLMMLDRRIEGIFKSWLVMSSWELRFNWLRAESAFLRRGFRGEVSSFSVISTKLTRVWALLNVPEAQIKI